MSIFKEVYLSEVEDLLHNYPDALLLDVRQPYEFAQVHLENALLIPLNELSQRIDEIKSFQTKPIIVYCKAGIRSAYACQILHGNGYNHLYNVSDGITTLL